jgi:hypothetical protein
MKERHQRDIRMRQIDTLLPSSLFHDDILRDGRAAVISCGARRTVAVHLTARLMRAEARLSRS